MIKTYSIKISKNIDDLPFFTGYFNVKSNTIISFIDNSVLSSCLIEQDDNLFNQNNLRFSFNGVNIKSKAIQEALCIEDNDIFNIFSYNYLDSNNQHLIGSLSSFSNIIYHFNIVFTDIIIDIKEID